MKQLKYVEGVMYEYEIYRLVDNRDPILYQKTPIYEFDNTEDSRYIAISLLETMKHHHGLGLAAPQCGLSKRVFVLGSDNVGYAFFNPKILRVEGSIKGQEGCLSFPGLYLPVERPEAVTVSYCDMNGVEKEGTFKGLTARIILHEYDHLEGITFTSHVKKLMLDMYQRKAQKNIKRMKRENERIERNDIIKEAAKKVISNKKTP